MTQVDRQLFALGGVHPRGSPDGPSQLRAECLLAGPRPNVEVTVRIVQAVERLVLDRSGRPVDELVVTGRRYSSGEESWEREVRLSPLPNRTAAIRTAGSERAELTERGETAGAQLWRWEDFHATVEAWTEEVAVGLWRVRVEVSNRLEWDRGTPEQNSMRTLRSSEVALHSPHSAISHLTAVAA